MLSEMAHDAIPCEVTPQRGEGALGAWRTPMITPVGTQSPKSLVKVVSLSSGRANRSCPECMRAALKSRHFREGSSVKVARVANRTREIRPSGMRSEARRTVTMVEL